MKNLTQSEIKELIAELRQTVDAGLLDRATITPAIVEMEAAYQARFDEATLPRPNDRNPIYEGVAAALSVRRFDKSNIAG